MFQTSFRLMKAAGGFTNSDADKVRTQFGSAEQYGFDRPIAIGKLAEINMSTALYGLRAVYPEQLTAAGKVARKLAIGAYRMAADRFPDHRGMIDDLAETGADYLWGLASRRLLADNRQVLFTFAESCSQPLCWLAMSAWLCLLEEPLKVAPEILDCCQRAQPETTPAAHKALARATENTMRIQMMSLISSLQDVYCPGPVARGFYGSFDPVSPKRLSKKKYRLYAANPIQQIESKTVNQINKLLKMEGH